MAMVERSRLLKRLRRELREVRRRDYFPPAERELARRAVDLLGQASASGTTASGEVIR